MTPRHLILGEKAVKCFYAGQHRESADFYWKSFVSFPNEWDFMRWQVLTGYTSILREMYFEASKGDMKNLKKLAHDERSGKVYRSEAAWTAGFLSWDHGDRDSAADFYREALAIMEQADETELNRQFCNMNGINTKDDVIKGISGSSVRDIMAGNRKTIERNLSILENPFGATIPTDPSALFANRSDGSRIPIKVRCTGAAVAARETIAGRLTVGGSKCDECGKSWQDVGKPKLDCCTRCKMAFYCSRDCQKKAWRAGHREACREKGQIEINDVMKLQGLQSKPELNDCLVTVLAPDTTAGRWRVKSMVSDSVMSIATDKLTHIRPAK